MEQVALHELTAAYALDALDADERREYENHLRRCERCRGDLRSLQEAAAMLAFATEPVAPPASLRDRIVARATSEGRKVVPLRPRWVYSLSGPVAAVAACAAIGLGLWATSLSHSLDQERRKTAVIDEGARVVALKGTRGRLFVSSSGKASLVLAKVPPAGKSETYEVWVVKASGSKPVRAGLFSGGRKREIVSVDERVPHGGKVMVTRERSGGVDAPQSKPLFSAQA